MSEEIKADIEQFTEVKVTAAGKLEPAEGDPVLDVKNQIDVSTNLDKITALESNSEPEPEQAEVVVEDIIVQDEDISIITEEQVDAVIGEHKSEEESNETEKELLTDQDPIIEKTEIVQEQEKTDDPACVTAINNTVPQEPENKKDELDLNNKVVEEPTEQPLEDVNVETTIENPVEIECCTPPQPVDTKHDIPVEKDESKIVALATNEDQAEFIHPMETESIQPMETESIQPMEIESIQPMETETSEVFPKSNEIEEEPAKQIIDVNEEQPVAANDLIIDDDKSDDIQTIESNVLVIEIDDDDDDENITITSESTQKPKEDISVSTKVEEVAKLTIDDKTNEKKVENETTVEPMEQDQTNTIDTVQCNDVNVIESLPAKENITSSKPNASDQRESPVDDGHNLLEETHSKEISNTIDNDEEDDNGDVYYNKECLNYECQHLHKQFFRAPLFTLSYFKISKKKFKPQYICSICYDQALEMYEEFSGLLAAKQPLLLKDVVGGRQEFVEIIDSSDEDDEDKKGDKAKDKNCFSKEDIKLIEDELDNSIRRVLDRVEIQNQLTWSKTILTSRLKALDAENNYIEEELRSLQKRADNMHVALYQCPKIKVRQLQPFDLNTGRPYTSVDLEISLPSLGEIQRPPIQINETYYAVKNKAIASWVPCKIMEPAESTIVAQKNIKSYKIKFLKSHYQMVKTVSVKHLAYFDPPSVRLPIGSRVIAYFDATSLSRGKEKMMIQSAFYPGIIAEPLKPNNKYRYLIFYDDGYTQYVYHKDVRLVCNVSENVWEDVHPGSRDFIQKYLTQYSINRPMVQTQKGQSMTTESNGKWIYARVVDIDCSLIQMQFEGPKSHTEWIYRGSMRLGPVFKEHQKTMQKTQMPISRLPRRTEPFIRYTEDEEATTTQQQQQQQRQIQEQQQNEPRAVAKKSVSRQESTSSTSQPVPTVRHLNNSTIYLEDENKPKGKVVYYTAKRNLPPLTYSPHTCSPSCLFKITHNLSAYSPLSKPLLSGWERMIIRQKAKKVVTYRGPCGKILRNMKELRNYLRATENVLNVENFDFNHETNCLAEYVIDSAIVQVRDISCGQEKMAIPLVNYYDNTMPPECKYAAQRIPTEGVNLNLDEEFLAGCDCEDDCSDKSKCSCWQLTYAGAKYGNPNTPMEEIGYQYKRLYEHVPTGIYECNSRCKCKSNCLNRVVQHSLEMKLQVFKTSNRGWGLRCINDIPRGSFICVYAGHLLTEDRANEGGLDVGDEYFAELDYIEVAEQIKEGYESDIESAEHEEDDEFYEQEDDDEFTPSKPLSTRSKARAQRSTRGNQPQSAEDDSQERQMINFNPNAVMDENSMRESSIRKLYGKDEACYVMDAKITGNLGRYFNHSCLPNLFVQNVLVDTHDLRFPWVAFFASTHIRAGTELTWNYNYEVGVVPGKVLYCQCGAPNCRLRLL